jgi:hypothetical protein
MAVNVAGFHPYDEVALVGLARIAQSQPSRRTFRVYSPVNIAPTNMDGRAFDFELGECGLAECFVAEGFDASVFDKIGAINVFGEDMVSINVPSTLAANSKSQGRHGKPYRRPTMDCHVLHLLEVRHKHLRMVVSPSSTDALSWSTPVGPSLDLMH